jgi:hypothetical protein
VVNMPAESTEIDAHNSHVRRRITCDTSHFSVANTTIKPMHELAYNLKLQVRLPYPSLKSLPPINRSRKTQIPGVRYRGF